MATWKDQIETLIAPSVEKSKVTRQVLIDRGALAQTGAVAASVTASRHAIVFADDAGYSAAGDGACESLRSAGFTVETIVLPSKPLPKASVEEAAPFVERLAHQPNVLPVSVGSGIMNDLVKFAAFQNERAYVSVATAASMDGYTSAGSPLARGGFKVTIPTKAPVALIADLDVIANAPAEMTGWGYGDLAGKSPAGGDWILADLVGAEAIDDVAFPMVQDNLRGWLTDPDALSRRDFEATARLFIGLTAVGFAMEFHASSRPASGADHQIAHMWEMQDLKHKGQKVSHGAAVAIGCAATLGLYDWLLDQDLTLLNTANLVNAAPSLKARHAQIDHLIADHRIAERAKTEVAAKFVDRDVLKERLGRIKAGWPRVRLRLREHLYRRSEMERLLDLAGAPSSPEQIGVSADLLEQTIRSAAFIRSRYTILDFLLETGLFEPALASVISRHRRHTEEPLRVGAAS